MTKRERWTRRSARLLAFATVALVLYLWQHISKNTALYLSTPSAIGRAVGNWFSNPVLRDDIPITIEEAALGFCACMLVAVVFASILAGSKLLTAITAPYIAMWNAVPKIALAPLFILVFGISIHAKVIFIATATFIIPFFSLLRAFTSVDEVILDHAKVLGANRRALVRDVYLPAIVGSMAAILRLTAQFCLLGAVFSEIIASASGIGHEIAIAQTAQVANYLFAGVFIVAVMGFTLDRVIRRIERHFLTWRVGT